MRRFFTLAVMTAVVGMFCGSFNLRRPRPTAIQAQPGAAPQTGRGGGGNAKTTKPSVVQTLPFSDQLRRLPRRRSGAECAGPERSAADVP